MILFDFFAKCKHPEIHKIEKLKNLRKCLEIYEDILGMSGDGFEDARQYPEVFEDIFVKKSISYAY